MTTRPNGHHKKIRRISDNSYVTYHILQVKCCRSHATGYMLHNIKHVWPRNFQKLKSLGLNFDVPKVPSKEII